MTYERLAALERERVRFALATVVARCAPVSAHLGDRAVIYADGTIDGFVGGACALETVRAAGLRALAEGVPRTIEIESTCASEGALDVYIEPHVPRPLLLVVGDTPVAAAVAELGEQVEYDVMRILRAGELPAVASLRSTAAVAIVATQGQFDGEALTALFALNPSFLGLVASRRRGAAVLEELAAQGVAREQLDGVRTPAGLDIGARTPAHVAVAILAEVIASTADLPVRAEPERAEEPGCGHCAVHAS